MQGVVQAFANAIDGSSAGIYVQLSYTQMSLFYMFLFILVMYVINIHNVPKERVEKPYPR